VNAAGLADRITEAASAETEPRNRVQQLTAALDSAVAAQKYADAETLRDELDEARGTLAFAEATTSALRQAEQATEAQRAADSLRIQLAQAKDAATAVIDSAAIAEKRAMGEIDTALAEMWAAIEEAQRAFRTALAWESKAYQERLRAEHARMSRGDYPPGHLGATPPKPNKASILAEQDVLIRALAAWRR
jgi:hypothetical protein